MSVIEVKTWRFRCNECGAEALVQSPFYPSAPDGWGDRKVYGCGLTGYTRDEDICPDCQKGAKP